MPDRGRAEARGTPGDDLMEYCDVGGFPPWLQNQSHRPVKFWDPKVIAKTVRHKAKRSDNGSESKGFEAALDRSGDAISQ